MDIYPQHIPHQHTFQSSSVPDPPHPENVGIKKRKGHDASQETLSPSLPCESTVAPDSCSHVPTAGCEQRPSRTWCDGNDRVFVTLKHHLRNAGLGIPELNTTIFGAAHDPLTMWGQTDAQDVVLKSDLSALEPRKSRNSGSKPYVLQKFECISRPSVHYLATCPSVASIPTS